MSLLRSLSRGKLVKIPSHRRALKSLSRRPRVVKQRTVRNHRIK